MIKIRYIVIVGTLFGNKTIHGLFDNTHEASAWANDNAGGQNYEVVPLQINVGL